MSEFATLAPGAGFSERAPDGSDVRVLLSLPGASMIRVELAAGAVAKAVAHRTVDELWFVLAGRGEMWRRHGQREEIVALEPGASVSIPLGTHFQFRASPGEPVCAVAVTIPPWPGEHEADFVSGPWQPTLP
jgi:mannose-6-phosphate isomerase-like protein (cupin superfamily)